MPSKAAVCRSTNQRECLLPRQNEKNVNEDLNEELRRELTIHYVHSVDEVLLLALTPVAAVTKARGDRKSGRRPGLRAPVSGLQ